MTKWLEYKKKSDALFETAGKAKLSEDKQALVAQGASVL